MSNEFSNEGCFSVQSKDNKEKRKNESSAKLKGFDSSNDEEPDVKGSPVR